MSRERLTYIGPTAEVVVRPPALDVVVGSPHIVRDADPELVVDTSTEEGAAFAADLLAQRSNWVRSSTKAAATARPKRHRAEPADVTPEPETVPDDTQES